MRFISVNNYNVFHLIRKVREKCHKILSKYDRQDVLTPAIKASFLCAKSLEEIEAIEAPVI
jgi:hypothetical protein